MPVLLYGVSEASTAAVNLPPGVGGLTVQSGETSGLTCFYSQHTIFPGSKTRESALEYHRVVSSLFQVFDVIPFRFPTLLEDYSEAASEIDRRAAEYHRGLSRVRGRAQMEIRIQRRSSQALSASAKSSGAAYLRARHAHRREMRLAADALRTAGRDLIERWHECEYADHLRCFALIARGAIANFQQSLCKATIAGELLARISGPWPPTEFLEEDIDAEA